LKSILTGAIVNRGRFFAKPTESGEQNAHSSMLRIARLLHMFITFMHIDAREMHLPEREVQRTQVDAARQVHDRLGTKLQCQIPQRRGFIQCERAAICGPLVIVRLATWAAKDDMLALGTGAASAHRAPRCTVAQCSHYRPNRGQITWRRQVQRGPAGKLNTADPCKPVARHKKVMAPLAGFWQQQP